MVLILVLMENTLGEQITLTYSTTVIVLILVLMENTLGDGVVSDSQKMEVATS